MKKLVLALLTAAVMAGATFAAQGDQYINVKAGLGVAGNVNSNEEGSPAIDYSTLVSFSVGGEYLYGISNIVSIGAGVEYVFPTKVHVGDDVKVSYFPVYATIKANVSENKDFFLKGNFGFVASAYHSGANLTPNDPELNLEGSLYWAVGFGYEFDKTWSADVMYSSYGSGVNNDNYTFTKVGISLGYKFKI